MHVQAPLDNVHDSQEFTQCKPRTMTINSKSITIETIYNNTILSPVKQYSPSPHDSSQSTSGSFRATWLTVSHQRWRSLLSIMRRPPTPSAPSRSHRSADVHDLCRRHCTVHRRRAFRHASSDPPTNSDVVCVIYVSIYPSVARSPLIYCPATQTTKESHHVVFVLQRSRAGAYQTLECRRRAVCSRSKVTPRGLFLDTGCLTPRGTETFTSTADCCGGRTWQACTSDGRFVSDSCASCQLNWQQPMTEL